MEYTKAQFEFLMEGYLAKDPKDVYNQYLEKSNWTWYHAMVSIEDIEFILNEDIFKYVACFCRCHQQAYNADTKLISSAHEHVHLCVALEVNLESWKRQLRRKNHKLFKTTFRPILCGDHLCGVLRYIACKDGQKIGKRGHDGLLTPPHLHYARRVFDLNWLHSRSSTLCGKVRDEIKFRMLSEKHHLELHNFDSCKCENGKLGKEKKKKANDLRREFYKSSKGQEIKKMYKDKKQAKHELTNLLESLGKGKKAELLRNKMKHLLEKM